MPAQRRIDLVLESVKRLQRIGASANLLNLLQKQHPADLAQIFGELSEHDRREAFALLVERYSRLARETLSEWGPEEGGAMLADRSLYEKEALDAVEDDGEGPFKAYWRSLDSFANGGDRLVPEGLLELLQAAAADKPFRG